jgi:phosphoribosyl 1,2-cyclic phosphodiesterase
MRVRFLGTGAAGGTPGTERSRRLESSALVSADARLLIDVTTHFERQSQAIEGIDSVLLTHAHRDAAGGFALLRRWWSDRNVDPIPVYASPEAIEAIHRRFKRLDHCRFVPIDPGSRVAVGSVTAKPLEVPHARERAFRTFAWRLVRNGVTVVYASDVAELTATLRRFASGARLLVIDGAMWRSRIFTHLTVDEALPELCDWPVERILLTQIGRTAPPHDRFEREARRLCPRARPAYDGLEARVRQNAE